MLGSTAGRPAYRANLVTVDLNKVSAQSKGPQNRFLSGQPSNCTKLQERFLFYKKNKNVKLRMLGLICELFAFKTLGIEDRVYSTENQI